LFHSLNRNETIFYNLRNQRARVICRMRIAECGKLSRGNLWKIKCGPLGKLRLVAFPHSAGEKFRIFADRRKTTVRSPCTTDAQPMHRSIRRPAVPSFCILCGPFATKQGSFFYNFLTSKPLQHSKCHIILLVSVIGFKLYNQYYSCRHDGTN